MASSLRPRAYPRAPVAALLAVLAAVLLLLPSASAKLTCRRAQPLTKRRCLDPPVFRRLSLRAYVGRWYQLYTIGLASRLSNLQCVTANYTQTSPASVAVLNCQRGPTRPSCLRGTAAARPGARFPSQLQVQFAGLPPGQYNVAAILGRRSYGYFAAAVYSCGEFPPRSGKLEEQWFLLGRSPYKPRSVFHELTAKLKCKGYDIAPLRKWARTWHGDNCKYIEGEGSFDEMPPMPPQRPFQR